MLDHNIEKFTLIPGVGVDLPPGGAPPLVLFNPDGTPWTPGGGAGLVHITENEGEGRVVDDLPSFEVVNAAAKVGMFAHHDDDWIGYIGFSTTDGFLHSALPGEEWSFQARPDSDGQPRIGIKPDGTTYVGPGNAPPDFAQWRSPAGDSWVLGGVGGKVGVAGQEYGFMIYEDGSAYAENDAAGTSAGLLASGAADLWYDEGGLFGLRISPQKVTASGTPVALSLVSLNSGNRRGVGIYLQSPDGTKIRTLRLSDTDTLELV